MVVNWQTFDSYLRQRRHRGLNVSSDRLFRSSLFLLASAGTAAVVGFGFSVVVARIFTPEQVGLGMSLISATSLIAYLSMFGLNDVIVRFFGTSKNPDAQITQSLLVVGSVGLFISGIYVLLVPLYSPAMSFVRDNPLYALVFLFAGAAAGMNLLTDAVFVAARKPEYNLFVDGFVQGITKLVLPAVVIGLGAYGIFGAVAGGYMVAVVVSVLCMRHVLGFRFDFRPQAAITKAQSSYSFSAYLSSGLAVAPVMVLPLIALQALGQAETAYFSITFQIAFVLYGVTFAICQALFAEGSVDESRLVSVMKRSGLLLVTLQLPALIVVAVVGPFILSVFGGEYREHGQNLLVILAIGAIAVALSAWADSVLKLIWLMKSLVASGVVRVVVTIGLAQVWGSRGLEWFGWAWLIGNLVSGLYAVVAIIVHEWTSRRRHAIARPGVVTLSGSKTTGGIRF